MTGDPPRLAIALPPGWSPADGPVSTRVSPPDLAQAPQLSLTRWDVHTRGPALLVVGCFSASIDGWVDEADPIAQDKLSSVATSTAARAGLEASLRSEGRAREGDVRTERLSADAGGSGLARTWLGFDAGRAHACFALCGGGDAAVFQQCARAADGARLEGSRAAPPPSLGLRALVAVVHHPAESGAGLAAVLVAGGLLAIATRRRPPRRRRTLSSGPAVSHTRP